MAEKRNTIKIREIGEIGSVKVVDEVIAIIAGIAATDVDGVSSMTGNITKDLVSKLGMKGLSKGVRLTINENVVDVEVAINVKFGYNLVDTSKRVQDRVKTSIENMTGLEVASVNVHIASVEEE